MYLHYFAVIVFRSVKDSLMFSKYNYSLKANLVADCYVPHYLTCHIKRSPDADEKVQLVCQSLLLVLLSGISQYHDCYVYGVIEN